MIGLGAARRSFRTKEQLLTEQQQQQIAARVAAAAAAAAAATEREEKEKEEKGRRRSEFGGGGESSAQEDDRAESFVLQGSSSGINFNNNGRAGSSANLPLSRRRRSEEPSSSPLAQKPTDGDDNDNEGKRRQSLGTPSRLPFNNSAASAGGASPALTHDTNAPTAASVSPTAPHMSLSLMGTSPTTAAAGPPPSIAPAPDAANAGDAAAEAKRPSTVSIIGAPIVLPTPTNDVLPPHPLNGGANGGVGAMRESLNSSALMSNSNSGNTNNNNASSPNRSADRGAGSPRSIVGGPNGATAAAAGGRNHQQLSGSGFSYANDFASEQQLPASALPTAADVARAPAALPIGSSIMSVIDNAFLEHPTDTAVAFGGFGAILTNQLQRLFLR